jgi:Uma2 family endonuclease
VRAHDEGRIQGLGGAAASRPVRAHRRRGGRDGPERVEHNDRKIQAWLALRRAVRDSGVPCHVNGNGMTVEIGDSDYKPDAMLYCGVILVPGSIAVPNPLAVVEVLSPSTSATDRAWKPREYFRLLSVRHYLIVWADRQQIVYHRRDDAGAVTTAMLTSGEFRLDPPGIKISVEEIY